MKLHPIYIFLIGVICGMSMLYGFHHITKPPAIELIEAHPYTSNYRYILRVDDRVAGECYTFNQLWFFKPE